MTFSDALLRAIHALEHDVPRRFRGFAGAPVRLVAVAMLVVVVSCSSLVALVRWPVAALLRALRPAQQASGRVLGWKGEDIDVLVGRHRVVLVDVYADWCGPCMLMKPLLARLASDYAAHLTVAEVDATLEQRVATRYRIAGYPTCMLFRDGNEIARLVGSAPYEALVSFIRENLDATEPPASRDIQGAVCDPKTGVCQPPGADTRHS